jgi:hypothetical protein
MTDALVETLQESIERDAENVHSFIKKGLKKLSKNPKSVEEIELMNKHAMEIGVQKVQSLNLLRLRAEKQDD